MARLADEQALTTNSLVLGRIMRRELYCPRCPPNKGCNRREKLPHPSKYKNKRRKNGKS